MEHKEEVRQFKNFVWIDTSNLNKQYLLDLANAHQLNYYLVKDSIQQGHLPKMEVLDNYTFLILRGFTPHYSEKMNSVMELSNKIAFFYNDKKVITIHRSNFPFLHQVKEDLASPEDLVLFILHKMIKTYEVPLERLEDKVDEAEAQIFLSRRDRISLEELYFQKAQMRIIQKLLRITQSVVDDMHISNKNKSAFRDSKDLLISLMLDFDELIENSMHLLHSYLSINAQKSNDVMKLLTIFSAFFLPLTFIAGIYGMNFRIMPELEYEYGYPIIWGVMLFIAAVIWWWFKRRKIL